MILHRYFRKLGRFLKDREYRFLVLASKNWYVNKPADVFLKRMYQIRMGEPLNLEHPSLYTEKLQWLKMFDQRPEYTRMVDKYAAKEYVAKTIGPEFVIPLLGVWNRVEDIDFDSLPQQFVLKTTHDSGGIVICRDRKTFDISKAKKKLRYHMNRDYYGQNREWPYKNVPHQIIAEPYMEDSKQKELRDYKFFTFGGEPKVLYIAQGRGLQEETVADFFDMEFNHLTFTIDHDMAPTPPPKPQNFEKMKELAARLSAGTPQLRVDFYEVNGKVYFGEMTFFHCSGMAPFHPEQWNRIFGEWLILPPKQTEEMT